MTNGVKALGSSLGSVAAGGLKVFTAGVSAAASGVAALGASAIQSFADYEQLVGGVDTLFKESSQQVQQYADNAYKTAGLSANAYMETVTSFSASLLQSLEGDTEAAANAADMAITDMADNANKMGSSMESIQNAYQGFAKQNYTMLDNLKLGYGGTKTEMERLLADAEELSGIKYDINNLNDVYSAIHVIQTEIGITGTTAKEASATISGSVSAMNSAWSNLVTGIADDNADFDKLIDNFVESVVAVGENILPRVEVVIKGIGKLIEELLPIVVNEIPNIINDILPDLLQSGMDMITTILQGMQQNLPQIVQGALMIVGQLIATFISMLPQIIQMGMEMLLQLVVGIAQALPELIPQIVNVVITITETLLDNIDLLIDAGIELIIALALGLIEALPVLVEKIPEIIIKLVDAIVENAPKLLEAAWTLISMLIEGLFTYLPKLIAKIPDLIVAIVNKFIELRKKFLEVGSNIISGIWEGLSEGWDWLVDKVGSLASGLFDAAKDALDIHSPSRKFKWLGEMCIAGMDEPLEEYNPYDTLQNSMQANIGGLKASFAGAYKNGTYGATSVNANVNNNVTVVLEGDAKGVFKLVRVEKDNFVRSSGYNPLI